MKQLSHWYFIRVGHKDMRQIGRIHPTIIICSRWKINDVELPIFLYIAKANTFKDSGQVDVDIQTPKQDHIQGFIANKFIILNKIKMSTDISEFFSVIKNIIGIDITDKHILDFNSPITENDYWVDIAWLTWKNGRNGYDGLLKLINDYLQK